MTRTPTPIASASARRTPTAIAAALLLLLSACGGGGGGSAVTPVPPSNANVRPAFVSQEVTRSYDGVTDDLLTAGLGKTGLADATPALSSPPTAAELRRAAIVTAYRAAVDTDADAGYGTLHGPNVDAGGVARAGEGRVAGVEVLAYSDAADGSHAATLMVQVPASFNPAAACILAAPASGQGNVYESIAVAEWGLKRGCAVAFTDKGGGLAPHYLADDTVPMIDGTRKAAATAGAAAQFNAGLSAAEAAAFNIATPLRFAFKYAHSQRHPEKDWGLFTRQAIEFAFYVVNEQRGSRAADGTRLRDMTPANTLVIAAGIGTAGGAVLAAAEQDGGGLIGGVAVARPALALPANPGVVVQRGGRVQAGAGRTPFDTSSFAALVLPCVALPSADDPYVVRSLGSVSSGRCESLKDKGWLTASTEAAQRAEAMARLVTHGWEPEAAPGLRSFEAFTSLTAEAAMQAQSLSRARVNDALCGYSYGTAQGSGPATGSARPAYELDRMFAWTEFPTSLAAVFNDRHAYGFGGFLYSNQENWRSVSPSTLRQDMNIDGALCLRQLLTGNDAAALALQRGLDETRRNGRLGGRPTIVLHGRSDPLLPVNHGSRPYAALSRLADGAASRLSYIELTQVQQPARTSQVELADGARLVRLNVYLNRALDEVYSALRSGTALPPSQVLRPTAYGGAAARGARPTAANAPPFSASPAAADLITVTGNVIQVPD